MTAPLFVTVGAVKVTPVPPVMVLALVIAPPVPLSVKATVVPATNGPHVDTVPPLALSVAAILALEVMLPTLKLPEVTAILTAPVVVVALLGSHTHPVMLAWLTLAVPPLPRFK